MMLLIRSFLEWEEMFKWAIEPSLKRVTVAVNRNVHYWILKGRDHTFFFFKLYLGIIWKQQLELDMEPQTGFK